MNSRLARILVGVFGCLFSSKLVADGVILLTGSNAAGAYIGLGLALMGSFIILGSHQDII